MSATDLLGKLLLVQQTLEVLPDSATIASFLRRALGEIPGLIDVHLYVGGAVVPPSEEFEAFCAENEAAWKTSNAATDGTVGSVPVICLPLRTARHGYGTLLLSIDNEEALSPYRVFLQNIAKGVATMFETREYVQQLDATRMGLETQVAERTSALKKSAERFRNMVETVSDWVWEIDEKGAYTYCSARVRELLGYEPQDLIGKSPFELMPAAEAARVAAIFGALVTERKPLLALENVNLHKNGHEVVLESSGVPVFDSDGAFKGYRGIDRDITERKRTERETLEQFKLAETFFKYNVSSLVILDRNFNFVRVNEAYARACRREIGDFAGRNHFEMYPSDTQAIFEDVVRSKRPFTTFTRAFVFADQPERGTTYWDWTLTPILDPLGEVEYLVFSLQEVTERKRAEQEQRAAALYARSLIEANLDPLVTISPAGKITDVNKATEDATGAARERLVGTDFADYFTEPDKARAGYQEVLERGYVRDYPLTIRHSSGHTTDVLYNASVYRNEVGELEGVFAAARDITERKQAERTLHRANRALKALSNCNQALIHATEELQLLSEICRVIVVDGGYRLAWVGFSQHDAQKTVRPVAQFGYDEGYLVAAKISWADTLLGRGPSGTAIRTGTVQVNQNFLTNQAMAPWREAARARGYLSSIALPLNSSAGILGVLTIYAAEPDAFNEVEVKLLQELADDLAFGIEILRTRSAHERSAEQLQRSMEATIQAVAGTVEMRDAYTAGHQRRVAELATAIARDLGLAQNQVHGVYLAAVVHDLGKIRVPAEILSKPGKLSHIEFELTKAHPEAGYDILKDVDFPWPIAQIVFQHHERLDGSGYPRGLKGDEILLEARILMVADVVEAMASHRPYRPALGIELAL